MDYINTILSAGISNTMLMIILSIFIIYYIFSSLAIMKIAQKTNTPNPWLAWIPIANIFLLVSIAKQHWALALIIIVLSFIPIPIIPSIGVMVLMLYLWWLITERLGKPGPLSLLVLIPIIQLGYMLYLAYYD